MEGTGVTPDRKSLIDGHPLREQYLASLFQCGTQKRAKIRHPKAHGRRQNDGAPEVIARITKPC